mmetsp:Transcript_55047/g.99132  ORF Transcript_55047/g.99132 Transcript_55047/m.99132 type:complete len:80 (+) Transcript_55047:423-662(+)
MRNGIRAICAEVESLAKAPTIKYMLSMQRKVSVVQKKSVGKTAQSTWLKVKTRLTKIVLLMNDTIVLMMVKDKMYAQSL